MCYIPYFETLTGTDCMISTPMHVCASMLSSLLCCFTFIYKNIPATMALWVVKVK